MEFRPDIFSSNQYENFLTNSHKKIRADGTSKIYHYKRKYQFRKSIIFQFQGMESQCKFEEQFNKVKRKLPGVSVSSLCIKAMDYLCSTDNIIHPITSDVNEISFAQSSKLSSVKKYTCVKMKKKLAGNKVKVYTYEKAWPYSKQVAIFLKDEDAKRQFEEKYTYLRTKYNSLSLADQFYSAWVYLASKDTKTSPIEQDVETAMAVWNALEHDDRLIICELETDKHQGHCYPESNGFSESEDSTDPETESLDESDMEDIEEAGTRKINKSAAFTATSCQDTRAIAEERSRLNRENISNVLKPATEKGPANPNLFHLSNASTASLIRRGNLTEPKNNTRNGIQVELRDVNKPQNDIPVEKNTEVDCVIFEETAFSKSIQLIEKHAQDCENPLLLFRKTRTSIASCLEYKCKSQHIVKFDCSSIRK